MSLFKLFCETACRANLPGPDERLSALSGWAEIVAALETNAKERIAIDMSVATVFEKSLSPVKDRRGLLGMLKSRELYYANFWEIR